MSLDVEGFIGFRLLELQMGKAKRSEVLTDIFKLFKEQQELERSEESLKECISTLEHHKEILTSAIEKVHDIWNGQESTKESEILRNALIKVYQK